MKLEDKGPICAPPVLSGWPQHASVTIQSWPGVISAAHWDLYDSTRVDGSDFYVGEEELGHIHLNGAVHLPVVKELTAALLAQKFAEKADFGGVNWLQFRIQTEADAMHAIWLLRINYERLTGVALPALMEKIAKHQK